MSLSSKDSSKALPTWGQPPDKAPRASQPSFTMTAPGFLQVTEAPGDQQIPATGAGESSPAWSVEMWEWRHTQMAGSLIFCLSASLMG